MNELLNLQPVFEQEYKRVKAEAIEFIHENLKIDTGETMEESLNGIKKLIEAQKKIAEFLEIANRRASLSKKPSSKA